MADDPKLVVAITARLDQFEKSMKEAGLIAEREVKNIEAKLSTGRLAGAGAIGTLIAKGVEAAMSEIKNQIDIVIEQMLSLGAATKRTGVDLANLQRIGFATRFAGMADKDLFSGLDTAAAKMNEMNHHTTRLSALLDANNVKFRDQAGHVVNVDKGLELAAELMGRARTEADKIEIARLFGLSQQWVAVLGEGVEKFRQIKGEAPVKELENAVAHMKALDALASRLKAHFTGWGAELVVEVLPKLEAVARIFSAIATALSQKTVGGPLEDFATNLANKWAIVHGEIQSTLVALNKTKIEVTKGGAGVKGLFPNAAGAKSDLQKFDEQLSKHITLLEAEAATLGLSVGAQEKARQTALLTEAAKRQGLTIEQALTAERQKQINQAGALVQSEAQRLAAMQELVSASKEFGSVLSDAFKGLVLEGKKLDEVVKSLTNRMASKAIDKLFDMMFAPAAGAGMTTPFLDLLKGLQARAGGGPVTAGRPYMVGERGAEMFVPNRSGMIVPNRALKGGNSGMTFAPVTTIDARGSTMGEAGFRAILAENNRQMLRAVSQSAPARQRRLAMLGT